jgi:hypothetical protein
MCNGSFQYLKKYCRSRSHWPPIAVMEKITDDLSLVDNLLVCPTNACLLMDTILRTSYFYTIWFFNFWTRKNFNGDFVFNKKMILIYIYLLLLCELFKMFAFFSENPVYVCTYNFLVFYSFAYRKYTRIVDYQSPRICTCEYVWVHNILLLYAIIQKAEFYFIFHTFHTVFLEILCIQSNLVPAENSKRTKKKT